MSILNCLYTLLQLVNHYDLRFLSMSVMDFHTEVWIGGVMGGWCELTQFFF